VLHRVVMHVVNVPGVVRFITDLMLPEAALPKPQQV